MSSIDKITFEDFTQGITTGEYLNQADLIGYCDIAQKRGMAITDILDNLNLELLSFGGDVEYCVTDNVIDKGFEIKTKGGGVGVADANKQHNLFEAMCIIDRYYNVGYFDSRASRITPKMVSEFCAFLPKSEFAKSSEYLTCIDSVKAPKQNVKIAEYCFYKNIPGGENTTLKKLYNWLKENGFAVSKTYQGFQDAYGAKKKTIYPRPSHSTP